MSTTNVPIKSQPKGLDRIPANIAQVKRKASKSYLVTFTSDENTRWLYHPAAFMECLGVLCETAATAHTEGPTPLVVVTEANADRM